MARIKSKTKPKGRSQVDKFEEAASILYEALLSAKDRALQSLESLEQAVEQELALPRVRERMTGIDKKFGRLTKASRRELWGLVKVAEREVGAMAATVKGLSTALTSALTGKQASPKGGARRKKVGAKVGKRSAKARMKKAV